MFDVYHKVTTVANFHFYSKKKHMAPADQARFAQYANYLKIHSIKSHFKMVKTH